MCENNLALSHSIQLGKLEKKVKQLKRELGDVKDKLDELDRRTAGSKIIGGVTLDR